MFYHKNLILFLFFLFMFCNFSQSFGKTPVSQNVSVKTFFINSNEELLKFEKHLDKILLEIDKEICQEFFYKKNSENNNHGFLQNKKNKNFNPTAWEKNLKKYIKGGDESELEPVDGGRKSKQKKQALVKPTETVETEPVSDIKTIEEPIAEHPSQLSAVKIESEKLSKKKSTSAVGMGLDYYNSDEEEDKDDSTGVSCGWQNYVDKYRFRKRKDDDDHDKVKPQENIRAIVSTDTKSSIKEKSAEPEGTSSETYGKSQSLLDKIETAVGYVEKFSRSFFAEQVLKRVVFLLKKMDFDLDSGKSLLGSFKRVIDAIIRSNSLESVQDMLGTLPTKHLSHSMQHLRASHLSSARSYIHSLMALNIACVYYTQGVVKTNCLEGIESLSVIYDSLPNRPNCLTFDTATICFETPPDVNSTREAFNVFIYAGKSIEHIVILNEKTQNFPLVMISASNQTNHHFQFISVQDENDYVDSHTCVSKRSLKHNWTEKACKTSVEMKDVLRVDCDCERGIRLVSVLSTQFRQKRMVEEHENFTKKTKKPPISQLTYSLRQKIMNYLGDSNLWAFVLLLIIWNLFFFLGIWARIKDKTVKIMRMPIDLADNSARNKYIYLVIVKTGGRLRSGTTSQVYFNLTGTRGISASHHLFCHKYTVLQRLQTNIFLMRTSDSLGDLVAIKFWHQNTGNQPSWFCSWTAIADLQSKRIYYFLCNSWIGNEMFKDEIVLKTFQVAPKKTTLNIRYLITYNTSRNFTDNHTLFSIFLSPPTSRFTRFERVAVCMNLLLGYLMCNLLFLNSNTDQEDVQRKSIGRLMFSMERVKAAFYCALVMFPVTTGIEVLFQVVQRRKRKIGLILDWKQRTDRSSQATGQSTLSKAGSKVFLIQLLEHAKKITEATTKQSFDYFLNASNQNSNAASMQRLMRNVKIIVQNSQSSKDDIFTTRSSSQISYESTSLNDSLRSVSESILERKNTKEMIKTNLISPAKMATTMRTIFLESRDPNLQPLAHTSKRAAMRRTINDSSIFMRGHFTEFQRLPSGRHDIYSVGNETWRQLFFNHVDIRNNEYSLNEYRSERFDNGVFPWPFIIVAWTITIGCMFFFTFTVVYRTFRFNNEDFLSWFSGCFISFFMGMLIDDPFKIIIISFVYSLIVRKVREHAFRNANLVRFMCLSSLENVDLEKDDESLKEMQDHMYQVPQQTLNMLLVEAELIRDNAQKIVRNFFIYLILCIVSVATVYSMHSEHCFRTNQSYYRMLYHPGYFKKLKNVPEFWLWTQDVWLDQFYPVDDEDESGFKPTMVQDHYLSMPPTIKKANGTMIEWAFFLDGVVGSNRLVHNTSMVRRKAKEKLHELMTGKWLGGENYYTIIEAIVYVPAIDMAVDIATKVYLTPGGSFKAYGEVNSIPLLSDFFSKVSYMFALYLLSVIFQCVFTARNISYLGVADFFASFWNLLDLFVTALALLFIPTALVIFIDLAVISENFLVYSSINAEDLFISRLILQQMMNTSVILYLLKGFSFLRYRRRIDWYFKCLGHSTSIILLYLLQMLFPLIGFAIAVHFTYGKYVKFLHAIEYAFAYVIFGWLGGGESTHFVKFYGPFGGIVYEVGCLAYSILFKAIGVAVICYSLKYRNKSLEFNESLYVMTIIREFRRYFSNYSCTNLKRFLKRRVIRSLRRNKTQPYREFV